MARKNRRVQNLILVVLLASVSSLAAYSANSLEFLQRIEWIAYDHFVANIANKKIEPEQVVVVLVDDTSLQYMDDIVGRWPWPRSVFADVIDYISMGEPKNIVFDLLFAESQRSAADPDGLNDKRLIESTANAGNVVHAMQLYYDRPDNNNYQGFSRLLPDSIHSKSIGDAIEQSTAPQKFNNYLIPIDGLYQSSTGLGVVSVKADSDGVLRRTKLFFDYGNNTYPAISVAPLLSNPEYSLNISKKELSINETFPPLDEHGQYLVNYYRELNTFSMSGILSSIIALNQGEVEKIIIQPQEFNNKYVYIGASAVGLHDLKATPIGNKEPGVFLHASILANILNNDFLIPVNAGKNLFLTALLSLTTLIGIIYFTKNAAKVIWPPIIFLFFIVWANWQFDHNQVVAVIPPLLAIITSSAGGYIYLFFTQGREKNKIKKMFSQYVSSAALSVMMDNIDDYKNANVGSKETVSVLFSDIRGFTALSESLVPEKVVEILNYYFTTMTHAIHKHHGTIDKFIGDAIMATWGAPIKSTNHANDAVNSALDMIEALPGINEWLANQGFEHIEIGIGINTGEVVLGSIGSEQKADYTVIGDNVNVASRLEGATKIYGCQLIISEDTYKNLDNIPCVLIDIIRVKGKQQPVKIYTPLRLFTGKPPTPEENINILMQDVQNAFNAYLQQYWEDAIAQFKTLPNRRLGELYVSRCEQFIQSPPPPDWDGVYSMDNK